MRWYVMRNGETTGPVYAATVAGWVNQGMVDGYVRDESGGAWMPIAQSPFRHRRQAPISALRAVAGAIVFGFLASIIGGLLFGTLGALGCGVLGVAMGLVAGMVRL